jgi:Fic family protein
MGTCKNDGVEADTAELARMLSEGRTPRTPEGRLVRNTYEMLGELESLVGEDFSPELVGHLHERVIHGVDPGSLKRSGSRLRAVPSIFREIVKDHLPPGIESARSRPPDVAEDVLRQICDYANGTTGDPREPVAVKGYMVLASMGYWHPLPDFNATVARHMLRLLSVKSDFPVLGYLPTSVMLRRWSKGTLDPGTVRYETIEPGIPVEDGLDGTAEILVHLQLTAAAVNELRALIRSTKEEDEALGTTLRDAERFNYRQRDVLKQALRRPDTEFTLREHRLKHRTVYSTARADLIELTESGLLEKHVRGQAFVFTPAPDLRERLSHAGEDDRE